MAKKTSTPKGSARHFIIKSQKSLQRVPLISLFYASIAINILTLIISCASQAILPPEIPLFYGLAEGVEVLSQSSGLITPGAVSLLLATINILIALALKNKFLQQTLVLTSFVVSMFSLITVIKIIFLVGHI